MRKYIFLFIGILFGVVIFLNPKAQEFIGLKYIEFISGIKLVEVNKVGEESGNFLVPNHAITSNADGKYFVYRVRWNLLGKPEEKVVEVTIVSMEKSQTIISSDDLILHDRVAIGFSK